MMDKLISQQAAIDVITKRLFETAFNNVGIKQNIDETLVDVAENRLENWFNELQPVQRWVPCSERLPENGRQVLVFARSVHFALAKYDEMREADGTYKMQWVTFDAWKPFYKIKDVIAWMELPELYQERNKDA